MQFNGPLNIQKNKNRYTKRPIDSSTTNANLSFRFETETLYTINILSYFKAFIKFWSKL